MQLMHSLPILVALLAPPKSSSVDAFRIVDFSSPQTVMEGSSVILSCQTDDYYEFCIWKHKSDMCEFEWKRKFDAVVPQDCSAGLKKRISLVSQHEYNDHKCSVKLTNVTREDAGAWTCEMESYVLGDWASGTTVTKTLQVDVVPVADQDTTESTTESDVDNLPSTDSKTITSTVSTTSTTTVSTTASTTTTESTTSSLSESSTVSESEHDEDLDYSDLFNKIYNESLIHTSDYEEARIGDELHFIDKEDTSSSSESVNVVAIVVGCVGALLLIVLAVGGFFLYKKRPWEKRANVDLDWQKKENSKKLEMTNIIDDNDFEEPKVTVEVERQRLTYNGSNVL